MRLLACFLCDHAMRTAAIKAMTMTSMESATALLKSQQPGCATAGKPGRLERVRWEDEARPAKLVAEEAGWVVVPEYLERRQGDHGRRATTGDAAEGVAVLPAGQQHLSVRRRQRRVA